MKGVSRIGMALLIMSAAAPLALAGVNAGGWLCVHWNSGVAYTSDISDYSGLSGNTCTPPTGDCPTYDGATCNPCATVNTVTGHDSDPVVFWVMAAFPDHSCPRLTGVNFGLHYDKDEVLVVGSKMCGDFEITAGNSDGQAWPATDSGTGMTWNGIKRSRLTEVYWFAAYSYHGTQQTITVRSHPSQGAKFSDDSIPAVLDDITGFGVLGLAGAAGFNPCATPTETTTWGKIKASYGSR